MNPLGDPSCLSCEPLFLLKYFFSSHIGEPSSSSAERDGDSSSSSPRTWSLYSFSSCCLIISSSGTAFSALFSNLVPVADSLNPWWSRMYFPLMNFRSSPAVPILCAVGPELQSWWENYCVLKGGWFCFLICLSSCYPLAEVLTGYSGASFSLTTWLPTLKVPPLK